MRPAKSEATRPPIAGLWPRKNICYSSAGTNTDWLFSRQRHCDPLSDFLSLFWLATVRIFLLRQKRKDRLAGGVVSPGDS